MSGLRWVRLASVLLIVASFIALVRLLPADRLVAMLSSTVERLGAWGPVLFGAAYVLAAVLFVPGSALTLAAGALFGLWWGTVTVSIASTTAAGLAFLIGRYLARDSVRRWAGKSPKFTAIDGAIGERGWKIIALLRLSPAVPFSLGNYLYGLTAIRFWPYVITSWLAMLPGTFMYVYLGYAGRAGLSAAATGGASRSPGQWALLVIGLLATIVVTVYVTRIARKAIKEHTAMTKDSSTSPDSPQAHRQTTAGQGLMGTIVTAVFALVLAGCTTYAYANRSLIAGLFGPPAVTLAETYKDKADGPTFDHSLFDALLKKYVNDVGLVDYKGLKKDAERLDKYIAALAKAPIDQMGRDQRLALLINGYNALTLRLILDHYPIKSIKDIPADKRWDDKRWNIGGHVWSLSQIEQEQIRPHFKEPRIHFALVCAAIGCPPLRSEAYTADRLQEQLQAQAVYVHAHDRWFQFDPKINTLRLTSLYNWYGGDFEQVAGSVVKYAARYSPALQNALDTGRTPKAQFLDYDWSLNSQEGRS
jgi:uncharacterized membrane protein YdjX (TVP38/TMEM64 family)